MKKYFNLQLFDDDGATGIFRTDADALIPEEHAREIIQGAIEQSAALSMGRRLANMTSKQTKMPVLDALPIAYFVDGDAEQKKTAKQAWANKTIYAEEVAVIVPIPEAVLDDAEYDIWGEVKPRVQEAFGKVIDAAVFFGTGKPTNWRAGLVPTAMAAGAYTSFGANDDLYDKILGEGGVISKVEESGYFVSGHMADITMRAKLRGLRDEANRPLFLSNMQQAGTYTLDGSAMTFPRNGAWDKSEALMVCGDFSQLVYSIRQDITFKVFTEGVIQNPDGSIAYNLMQNDMVALRAVMRLGWELPNPINSLEPDNAKRFPFAVLKPAHYLNLSADTNIAADADLLGKTVSDLQTGLVISNTDKFIGTLKYVTGYTGFSGDTAEQSGNFMAVHAGVSNDDVDDVTIKVDLIGGLHGPVTLDDDGILIARIISDEEIVKITASAEGYDDTVKELSLKGVTLASA